MSVNIPQGGTDDVEDMGRLLRVAGVVRALRREIDQIGLDERGRERLRDVHQRTVAELRDLVSGDLQQEIDAFVLPLDGKPDGSEIRIAQAQLSGWLEGLFAGVQAAMESRQAQMMRSLAEKQQASERPLAPGQYL